MESQGNGTDRLQYLIRKQRYITLAVQVAPFAYTTLYIISLILYFFCPEPVLQVLDTLFYVSPVVICAFLIESHILKLCIWHKSACILPLLPQVFVFVDYHILELTEAERYVAIAMPLVLSILLLIAAYHVFIK